MRFMFAGVVATTVLSLGCSSTLKVAKIGTDGSSGVPFYPPRQDFVVKILGLDKAGNATPKEVRHVELVTSSDYSNGYLVEYDTAVLTTNEFSVGVNEQGRINSVGAKQTSEVLATIESIGSAVVSIGAKAAASPEREKEKSALEKLEKALIERLVGLKMDAGDIKEKAAIMRSLHDNLALVRTRIGEITKQLAPAPAVTLSGYQRLGKKAVAVVHTEEELRACHRRIADEEMGICLWPAFVSARSAPPSKNGQGQQGAPSGQEGGR